MTFFVCSQVLDYWTVEVSSSYVGTGMGNLPEGKGKSGFICYGVQLTLLPGGTPASALIMGAADLTSPIHLGTTWYK